VLHHEDRKGQLGFGVARVVTMVIVALLEEGVVRGLIRRQVTLPLSIVRATPRLDSGLSL
jgi:hypothetical protein